MVSKNPRTTTTQHAGMSRRYFERFTELEKLGGGASGDVLHVYDDKRRQEIALKLLIRLRPETLYQFKQEFRSIAGLTHPNVVQLYELIGEGDAWAVAMELVESPRSFIQHVRPYRHLLRSRERPLVQAPEETQPTADATPTPSQTPTNGSARRGRVSSARRDAIRAAGLELPRLVDALHQLLDGLDSVHRHGLVHRDIKPSNVLVDARGRLVVCDFGMVAEMARESLDAGGTPAYMAPEQVHSGHVTPASDHYGMGVMLYEALTGTLPFTGGSLEFLLEQKRQESFAPPAELDSNAPADLAELSCDLLRAAPHARPSAAEIRQRLSGRASRLCVSHSRDVSTKRLVGRSRELETLRSNVEQTRRGPSRAVFLSGPSGHGKSALAAAAVDQFRNDLGALVLSGRCYQNETVPFKALDAVMDELARAMVDLDAPEMPAHIDALATLFPVLRRAPGIARALQEQASSVPGHLLHRYASAAWTQLLCRLAKDRPVVICIDDLQWGDADSAPFVWQLLESTETPGVLLLATHRTTAVSATDDVATRVMQRTSPERLTPLFLGPLSSADAALLVASIAPETGKDAPIALLEEAEGSPLFLSELAHEMRAGPADTADRPKTLDEILRLRIEQLGPEARRLLEATALARGSQPVSMLSRAAAVTTEATALAELRTRRLVVVGEDRRGEILTTYHSRVREAALSLMTDQDQQRAHRRLARAVEANDKSNYDALAWHWLSAGQTKKGRRFAILAAKRALRARAYLRAAEHYRDALGTAAQEPRVRANLAAARADALFLAGSFREAGEAFDIAASLADATDAARLRGRALICALRADDIERADQLARQYSREFEVRIPGSRFAAIAAIVFRKARLGLSSRRWKSPRPDRTSEQEARQLELTRHVNTTLGFADTTRGYAVQLEYLLEAMRAGSPAHLTTGLVQEALFTAALRGAVAQPLLDEMFRAADQAARRTETPALIALVDGYRAMVRYALVEGLRDSAEQLDSVSARLDADPNFGWETNVARLYAVNAHVHAGAVGLVSERVPQLLRGARDGGDDYLYDQLCRQMAVVAHVCRGELDDARAKLEGRNPWTSSDINLNTFFFERHHAEIEAYQGQWGVAAERFRKLWHAMRGRSIKRIVATRCWVAYGAARYSSVAAATEPARRDEHLRYARQMMTVLRKNRRGLPGMSRAMHAQVQATVAALSSPELAIPHLRSALEHLESCQAGLHAQAARFQLGTLTDGDEGRALRSAAESWARAQGIDDTDRFFAWMSPIGGRG